MDEVGALLEEGQGRRKSGGHPGPGLASERFPSVKSVSAPQVQLSRNGSLL